MGAGAFIEPAVVVGLLFGGTWINRDPEYSMSSARYNRWKHGPSSTDSSNRSLDDLEASDSLLGEARSGSSSPFLLPAQEARWRKREVRLLGLKWEVTSPNTRVFRGHLLSRLLRKFPFLVEAWYWALIYWVRICQTLHSSHGSR